jgi:hypothetical protein
VKSPRPIGDSFEDQAHDIYELWRDGEITLEQYMEQMRRLRLRHRRPDPDSAS